MPHRGRSQGRAVHTYGVVHPAVSGASVISKYAIGQAHANAPPSAAADSRPRPPSRRRCGMPPGRRRSGHRPWPPLTGRSSPGTDRQHLRSGVRRDGTTSSRPSKMPGSMVRYLVDSSALRRILRDAALYAAAPRARRRRRQPGQPARCKSTSGPRCRSRRESAPRNSTRHSHGRRRPPGPTSRTPRL